MDNTLDTILDTLKEQGVQYEIYRNDLFMPVDDITDNIVGGRAMRFINRLDGKKWYVIRNCFTSKLITPESN